MALAVQPRTLEVLRGLDVTGELLARGNDAVRLRLHAGGRTERVDTRYLVGCDGTWSSVRRGAGIPFQGGA